MLQQMMDTFEDGALRIYDATQKPDGDVHKEYNTTHISGARFFDLMLVRDQQSKFPYMMPPEQAFTRMMKAMDIRKSQTVVFYESGKGWFATRAAFVLRAFGHENVYVLDGGLAKWTQEGKPVEEGSTQNWDSDFSYKLQGEKIYSYEQVKQAEASGEV